MICCDNLVHPFQNDPGTSQRQRIIEDLLGNTAKIDGRTLADLLTYFTRLSRHVNYYDADLRISDWQAFFKNSLPFLLSAVVNYKKEEAQARFDFYNALFDKRPSARGLQLLVHFFYHRIVLRLNEWHQSVKGSGLIMEGVMEKLIRDQLYEPVRQFLCFANLAVQKFKIKKIDFTPLQQNEAWNLKPGDLSRTDTCSVPAASTKQKQLAALKNEVAHLFAGFASAIEAAGNAAEISLEASLFPLKEELQKKHAPHLALIFAFLKLFQHLQSDLNGFTKKHLDFFYKDVLQLKPGEAVPDKAHLLIDIQNQLQKYLLKKDTLAKDGKDNNKADILYALQDEIVVNKTQIADAKTLFLNNKTVQGVSFVEGVYVAPDARKADGVKIDFKDSSPKNWPTLGASVSKYQDPEQNYFKPYPNARIGFLLASPVLLLNEGTRTVTITLPCVLHNDYCAELMKLAGDGAVDTCCEEGEMRANENDNCRTTDNIERLLACKIFDKVNAVLNQKYYYLSKELIQQLAKKGAGKAVIEKLFGLLSSEDPALCYCPTKRTVFDRTIPAAVFEGHFTSEELQMVKSVLKPEGVFKVSFSGEKEWIEPSEVGSVSLQTTFIPNHIVCIDNVNTYAFTLTINAILNADKPAVTFYDKDKLKEDFNTTLPVVKVELNDHIKLIFGLSLFLGFVNPNIVENSCCLLQETDPADRFVSLYHFFRNLTIDKARNDQTKIDVIVCGLKNVVVQNSESVMDVNGPIYPWGTRPEVKGFDKVNPTSATGPKIGPDFYIGSKEVLCKKWNEIFINLNWKNKPENFNEYYKAYWVDPVDSSKFGLNENDFQINIAVLEDGKWKSEKSYAAPNPPPANNTTSNVGFDNRLLFGSTIKASFCTQPNPFEQTIYIAKEYINSLQYQFKPIEGKLVKYDVNTREGFLKVNLQNQDFLHKDYAFVLARQMMAFGKLPNEHVEGAVYYDSTTPGGGPIVISTNNMLTALNNSGPVATRVRLDVQDINTIAGNLTFPPGPPHDIDLGESNTIRSILRDPDTPNPHDLSLVVGSSALDNIINNDVLGKLNNLKKFAAIIPNEPWTPVISSMAIDYTATAESVDIDLIHLYPYQGTYKAEAIGQEPALFPTFCEEGTLFLGLQGLVPGSNLTILFQLAEATADSESVREEISWHYLDNNEWKHLRKGFEVLDDATDGLTTSGIIKFALPENMTNENTVMPPGLHWIKASIPLNSRSVSETIGIHTQAVKAVFTNAPENDKLRLKEPLPAGSISRLNEADANVKQVLQPYDSFGGSVPEAEGKFYTRVSEELRHKGRAIQKWDYERLVLEAFPQIYKTKCINHSNALDAHRYKYDFPMAPGYVLLAVIPDLTQLEAGNSLEPRAPVSLLENVAAYLKKRTSPFVRLNVMNPRYEKVNFCLKVKLYKGKDENYYKEKLDQDVREFMAPWAVGEYDKLNFGQCISRSALLRFLESLDYIDYLIDVKMLHEMDMKNPGDMKNASEPEICPKTPRSILTAGLIDVCIPPKDCDDWYACWKDNVQIDCCSNEAMPVKKQPASILLNPVQ